MMLKGKASQKIAPAALLMLHEVTHHDTGDEVVIEFKPAAAEMICQLIKLINRNSTDKRKSDKKAH